MTTVIRLDNVTTYCIGDYALATCFYVYCANEAENDMWWGGCLDNTTFTDWYDVVVLLTRYFRSPITRIEAEGYAR